jgi:hypothetical protein
VRQQDDSIARRKTTSKRPAKLAHRGVRLLKPDARRKRWRVRYRDPDTDTLRTEPVPLPPVVHDSKEGRATYAAQLLRKLQRRREEIEAGATPHVHADLSLKEAIARYFTDNAPRLRARTQRAYLDPCDAFLEWADGARVATVRQLSRGKLKEFAAHVARQPSARGGDLSPRTVNKPCARSQSCSIGFTTRRSLDSGATTSGSG